MNYILSYCFIHIYIIHIQVCVWVTSVMSNYLWPHGLQAARLLCPWDSPAKNTGMGFWAILQGIFPTQQSHPCLLCLLHWLAGATTSATWEVHTYNYFILYYRWRNSVQSAKKKKKKKKNLELTGTQIMNFLLQNY